MHLGNVDKFNNLTVAAYVTAAHVKFLLLHDGKNDEAIRLFFKDVYDIYVRVSNLCCWPLTRASPVHCIHNLLCARLYA